MSSDDQAGAASVPSRLRVNPHTEALFSFEKGTVLLNRENVRRRAPLLRLCARVYASTLKVSAPIKGATARKTCIDLSRAKARGVRNKIRILKRVARSEPIDAFPGVDVEELVEMGVLIDVALVPTRAGLSTLDRDTVSLLPAARRSVSQGAREGLIVNPALVVQHGDKVPRRLERFTRNANLPSTAPLVWQGDPGTGISVPSVLSGEWGDVIDGLQSGAIQPRDLSGRLVEDLSALDVLVERERVPEARRLWDDQVERAREAFGRDDYCVLRGVLSPPQIASVRSYLRGARTSGFFRDDTVKVLGRAWIKNEPVCQVIHNQFEQLANRLVPETVKRSYNFLSDYAPGSVLDEHTDREQCFLNASLVLDMGPTAEQEEPWPIYLRIDGEPKKVLLGLGDVVFFHGTKTPHWRDALPDGHETKVCFLHFVERHFTGTLE
jgi:hypothetical protein